MTLPAPCQDHRLRADWAYDRGCGAWQRRHSGGRLGGWHRHRPTAVVDLSSADVIVGTSAGSIVGSHVAFGTDLQALAAMSPAPQGADAAAVPAVILEVILSALSPA